MSLSVEKVVLIKTFDIELLEVGYNTAVDLKSGVMKNGELKTIAKIAATAKMMITGFLKSINNLHNCLELYVLFFPSFIIHA